MNTRKKDRATEDFRIEKEKHQFDKASSINSFLKDRKSYSLSLRELRRKENFLLTNGFDFLEFATRSPQLLIEIFTQLGFVLTGCHRYSDVFLLEQAGIKFIINAEPNTEAAFFESIHGSGACGMGFRVKNSDFALQEAVKRGAKAVLSDYDLPAIEGIGNSKIYLMDSQISENFFDKYFESTGEVCPKVSNITYIDHITHNTFQGNMDVWAKFYEDIFNFQEIRFFDIKGKKTGLRSRALVSPCGKIRIPLNESQDDISQIAEFLKIYNGEGIQHIAFGCRDIYSVVEEVRSKGIALQDTPDSYYETIGKRIQDHQENVPDLQKLKILIDGGAKEEGILLQIFTKEVIGPIFFEFIERKGNKGFGEGNFQALFESIELDQIRRGVLGVEATKRLDSTEEIKHPMFFEEDKL